LEFGVDTRAISTGVHTVILRIAIELVSMCLSSLFGLAILSRAVLDMDINYHSASTMSRAKPGNYLLATGEFLVFVR
jgi:hypothetical protein